MMVCLLTCDEFIWITDGKAVLLGPLLSTNTHKHSEFYERRQGQERVNRTKDLGRGIIADCCQLTEVAHAPETGNLENSLGTVCERH